MKRCSRCNIVLSSLVMTLGKSVVFFGYFGFFNNHFPKIRGFIELGLSCHFLLKCLYQARKVIDTVCALGSSMLPMFLLLCNNRVIAVPGYTFLLEITHQYSCNNVYCMLNYIIIICSHYLAYIVFLQIKHILLLNIITIGLDTNYNNLQGSSPRLAVRSFSGFFFFDGPFGIL
jgi:hypothetical protein